MPEVVADSTVIIFLSNIGHLWLIKELYEEIYIPEAVLKEIRVKGESSKAFRNMDKADYIKKFNSENIKASDFLSSSIHKGEAEVIALAKQIEATRVIIDDYAARKHARYLDLNVTGTLGVLLRAKNEGLIDSVKPLVDKMIEEGFHVDDKLYNFVLKKANE
ncbi:DUF3368 domain-containing protein [Halarsenatibacter silvermanii]|uniref:Predicted nucleic acid-binding protein, contains PIN domain n=1 Tax=Halarsenatibacter silvermanii TaxID=321763 RepID=A0A1G9M333_9FIRM|nr:DUF3368 domain-containing protein [Halarsenatibacter silvermanii]SDL68679.1 Predicted nucleic acid-binding protein, contains PIN domain [Halarsenatibacter silvermanii]